MTDLSGLRRVAGPALAFASVVGLVVGAAVASQGADALVRPGYIRVTTEPKRFYLADLGRPGRSPGDVEVVWQTVFNRRITQRPIGHYEMVCTYSFGPSRSCELTLFFQRGRIVAAGALRTRRVFQLAVTGGTQFYENAQGTMTVTRTRSKPSRDRVVIKLIG